MKRKTIAFITALTLSVSLSACGDKTTLQADKPDTTGVGEPAEAIEGTEVTEEEYDAYLEKGEHQHTLPYACFYDIPPCSLEEMVNYLNAYASVMSDGQSVPVEIRKAETARHDGAGVITKGEMRLLSVLQDMCRKQLVKADKMMPVIHMVFWKLLYMEDEESALRNEVAS